jgi:hypothetical protein
MFKFITGKPGNQAFLLIIWIIAALLQGCTVSQDPPQPNTWKSFWQLNKDLKIVTAAGYSQLCLFDLKSLRDYPDSKYIPLLKSYADEGIQITVYVQEMEANEKTLQLAQSIGASAVILYEKDLLTLFKEAGYQTYWWAGVAYPRDHSDLPTYLGWPDLRSAAVRQNIADWVIENYQKADTDGGVSLDYIRWNRVGDGREAEQITDLVQRIRSEWLEVGKGSVTAAVYPYMGKDPSYGGALSVGQQWDQWLKNGLIDVAYPMAYKSQDIPVQLKEWAAYDKQKIVPCLSVMNY